MTLASLTSSRLWLETLGVGAVAAVVFTLLTQLLEPDSLWRRASVGFLTGAVIHLVFELVGWNAYYCQNGAACMR